MATCSIQNCSNTVWSKGLCNAHCQRKRLGIDLEKPIKQLRVGENRSKNPLYTTYRGMIQRCSNPNQKYYSYYGGRGIKVCERWTGIDGFTYFAEDMGEKPEGMTLDRKDNDGDYTPDNCQWATRTTQQINQRINNVNTSGIKGVHYQKAANSWMAYINYRGKRKHLGYFKEKADAVAARKDAEIERLLSNMKGN